MAKAAEVAAMATALALLALVACPKSSQPAPPSQPEAVGDAGDAEDLQLLQLEWVTERVAARQAAARKVADEAAARKKEAEAAEKAREAAASKNLTAELHPMIPEIIKMYSFRSVENQRGEKVNIILQRSPWQGPEEEDIFNKYHNEILFIGMSSLEDFPLPPPNPFSPKFAADKYVGIFPGYLNMYHHPERIYPAHVKTLLMSQSDFSLPERQAPLPKKYDFALSGTDQDVENNCVGWSSYAKNWTFVLQALDVMCGELNMTGVLAATKSKSGEKACTIPASCEGKMLQTSFLPQQEMWDYIKQSHFLFAPQVHDASPRVVPQALELNTPVLMNRNIIGGWKYVNERTGEFFNDMGDFRESLQKIMHNAKAGGVYEPRKYIEEVAGGDVSGQRLFRFIDENFQDRVKLPEGTTHLYLVGA